MESLNGITGVVLAGGMSSRFGQDKSLFEFRGKPLVDHAVDILRPVCGQIMISTNRPDDLKFTGLPLIKDIYNNCGPIGGIHSGLYNAQTSGILFLGCDMPLIPAALMCFLAEKLKSHQAVVPRHRGFNETLCLAMNKSVLEYAEKAIERQQYKVLTLLEWVNTCYAEVSAMDFYSPEIFSNINYRSDLNKL